MKTKSFIGIAAAAGLGLLLWSRTQTVSDPAWEQLTMGTVCHITLAGQVPAKELVKLRMEIDAVLSDINRSMSIWDPESEISEFNRHSSTEPFPLSEPFAAVVQQALLHSAATGGAFDPTVKPLVEHWGFGPGDEPRTVEEIMKAVGWQKIRLQNGSLSKTGPDVQLDLAAIAKGYGVDRAAGVLRESGLENFLVEIGGEIVAQGVRAPGRPWRIGIESPEYREESGTGIYRILSVRSSAEGVTPSLAMATSGDYRNVRVRPDGTRYSHLIDPRKGIPVESDVASVTVIADTCMDADAIATALCVMGADAGLIWLKQNPEFQAFFILHDDKGSFTQQLTDGFPVSD